MPEFNDRRPGGTYDNPKPYITKGGQGKLFQDPKPTDEHRYPRGYTPDRMAEVRGMPIKVLPSKGPGSLSGMGGAHQVHQIIARSTTPADETTLRRGETQNLTISPAGGRHPKAPRATAWYENTRNSSSALDKPGRIGLSGEQSPEREGQNLLHELGHWRSNRAATPSSYLNSPTRRGQEEALADDNMVNRWKPDPRDVRKKKSVPIDMPYEYESVHRGIGGTKSHAAYIKARTTPIAKTKFHAEQSALRADAKFQPNIFTSKGVEAWAKPDEGTPLHPMQFGKLGQ